MSSETTLSNLIYVSLVFRRKWGCEQKILVAELLGLEQGPRTSIANKFPVMLRLLVQSFRTLALKQELANYKG